jgi:hypothetical protein
MFASKVSDVTRSLPLNQEAHVLLAGIVIESVVILMEDGKFGGMIKSFNAHETAISVGAGICCAHAPPALGLSKVGRLFPTGRRARGPGDAGVRR